MAKRKVEGELACLRRRGFDSTELKADGRLVPACSRCRVQAHHRETRHRDGCPHATFGRLFAGALWNFKSIVQNKAIRYREWMEITGLPPPEMRGFVPRLEGDERPAVPKTTEQLADERYAARVYNRKKPLTPAETRAQYSGPWPPKPSWALPPRSASEPGPMWDNLVRAYEEDR